MKYQKFYASMQYLIENSDLEIGAMYFMLRDIVKDIEKSYYSVIAEEINKQNKKEEVE